MIREPTFFESSKAFKIARYLAHFVGLACLSAFVWITIVLVRSSSLWEFLPVELLFLVVYSGIYIYLLYKNPVLKLSAEGITVRRFFRSRFYAWKALCQAGILWRCESKGGVSHYFNDFVLILPGGSPRTFRDNTFLLRNRWKIVHLPMDPEIRDYVTAHYGPLDFDFTDGKSGDPRKS